jgi:DNA polymerase III epsilon subunit-like protein
MEKRLNLIDDDVMFLVLDCETTGLDDKTCHIIQLAAKVLGSDDENDLFSGTRSPWIWQLYFSTQLNSLPVLIRPLEYILPPIDHIPVQIEELTGITDEFLRNGGFDHALGKEKGTARDFRQVYHDLQLFCNERANGRSIVLIAHNAKFDVRMINGELRRWRFSDGGSPMLGETFTCYLDTLQLFRDRKWWRTNQGSEHCLPRPSSFSLSELHSHVLNESIANSHNAVGDVKALERLLLSRPFVGWKTSANELQVPFVRVEV